MKREQKKMLRAFANCGLRPFPHQRKLIEEWPQYPDEGLFLAWSMRLGKTEMASAIAYARTYGWDAVTCVICPLQVINNWKVVLEKMGVKPFFVATYGTCKDVFRFEKIDTLILDEIHCVRSKGSQSKNLKNVMHVAAKANYVLGLSGTMFDMDEGELYYPCKIVALDNIFPEPNRTKFYRNWCFNNSNSSKYTDYKMFPHKKKVFKKKLMPFVSFKEMEAKPPSIAVAMYCIRDTAKIRNAVLKGEPLNMLNNMDFSEPPEGWSKAIRNQKALQLTSGFILDQDKRVHIVNPYVYCDKFIQLSKILSANDKDSVIFYRYQYESDCIHALLKERGILSFSLDDWTRQKEEITERKILVLHPLNGGVGLNLSEFQQLIYLTESDSGILAAQSKARLSVYGQDADRKTILYLLPNSGYGLELRQRLEKKEKIVTDFFKQ